MHLVYIDDSGDEQVTVFSAIVIPADKWKEAFKIVKAWRRALKKSDGILVYKELHAVQFVPGRGRPAGDKIVTKYRRSVIFKEAIALVAKLPGVHVFNACFPRGADELAFERLLNRINRTVKQWGSHAILFSDHGKEATYTRLARRMGVFNPIPSAYGTWETGGATKNIPIDFIIEDIIFKESGKSYLIQLADFCAYALLRREHPHPARMKYGIEKAFSALDPVLFKAATKRDPEGILRGTK